MNRTEKIQLKRYLGESSEFTEDQVVLESPVTIFINDDEL
ncbi:MAG: sulfurtransferase FdhD, partial [Peptococcaceae bacterium]|nr:sulfurtransferase FdhD [Peptococcaceae bacterium]